MIGARRTIEMHCRTCAVGDGSAVPFLALVALCLLPAGVVSAENIDPDNDDSQYAWSENVGWINAEPSGNGGPGIQVGDDELSGWMWGENIGWINLSCKNRLSCASVVYGVLNDGNGTLSGYAWAENIGWISFSCTNTGSCGTANYGVTIDDATGIFSGSAWAENVGWVSFNCSSAASCGTVDYKVKTSWICDPLPAAPSGSPLLIADESGSDTLLSWTTVADATGYDIVYGELNTLRTDPSGFVAATLGCLDRARTTTSLLFAGTPPVGDAYWFLVRGRNCGGKGTYGTVKRDTEIPASGNDCP